MRTFLAPAAALALLAAAPAPAEAEAFCRMVWFADFQHPAAAYFIAVGEADTVKAGAGSSVAEHIRRARARSPRSLRDPARAAILKGPAWGQRVRVERLAGGAEAAPALEAAFARLGSRTAILVPWDHDSECVDRLPEGSARWIEPGSRGAVRATPRPEREWIGGVPVLDVGYGYNQPYPQRRPPGRDDEEWMTADELLELWTALPFRDEDRAPGSPAHRRVSAWLRAHPEQAARNPARFLLSWHPDAPR
ncbi:MAG TPA: hypothetical protein VHG91_17760 [Longimicrobium sp.]|nr:hypothetical protein [Longimicrobium sp.]